MLASLAVENVDYRQQAVQLYWQSAAAAGWHRLWRWLTRRSVALCDLNKAVQANKSHNSHYGGLQTVPIERIRGSQGRRHDFDDQFNPLRPESRDRWLSIAQRRLMGYDLPPVELVEVNGAYFVRDGHHRISVARRLGQQYVDAEVQVAHLQRPCL